MRPSLLRGTEAIGWSKFPTGTLSTDWPDDDDDDDDDDGNDDENDNDEILFVHCDHLMANKSMA